MVQGFNHFFNCSGFFETLRYDKKVRGNYEDRRGFTPCPTPMKIFFWEGFGEGSLHSE
jgi:hypothetical protein